MSEKERDLGDTIRDMQSQIASNFTLINALIDVLEEQGVNKAKVLERYSEIESQTGEKIYKFFDTGNSGR